MNGGDRISTQDLNLHYDIMLNYEIHLSQKLKLI
jgi:hypothetical protein